MPVRRLWCALSVVSVLQFPHAGAAKSPVAPTWQPLTIGSRWDYTIARENRVVVTGQPPQTVKSSGTIVTVVKGASQAFTRTAGVVELVSNFHETATPGGERRGVVVSHVANATKGLLLYGQSVTGMPGAAGALERYAPGRTMLPAGAQPGQTWTVGEIRQAGTKVALKGEIVGIGPVSAGGKTYDDTLKARMTGTVSGTVTVGSAQVPVDSGQQETTSWYASGVGLVKEVTTLTMRMTIQGAAVSATQTSTRELQKATVK